MAGAHDDKGIQPPRVEAQHTIRVEMLPHAAPGPEHPDALIGLHLRTAARLLGEGSPGRAFGELVRATRGVPMTRRLAAALVAVSRKAGTEPAAATLLASGVEENEGLVRIDIRRQLARLLRKTGDLEHAREALVLILAEKPGDRRARRTLNALLAQEQRWEELDASLEKEIMEALRRGGFRRAARASLARGRLWGERLNNHAHAALRYGQAAELLEQARDFEAAFNVRLLGIRSLRESNAPSGAMQDAIHRCIAAGDRVDKEHRARAFLRELGLLPGAPSPLPVAAGQVRMTGRRSTQRELLAAAEEADAKGKRPEAAALLNAAMAEGPDPETERRLEAHYVARGAWRELAGFYRDRAARAVDPAVKAELLTRVAELLEDELHDPAAAARAYGEIVQLTGDERALREQIRLLSDRRDFSGVQRALDLAVQNVTSDEARAVALVARGEASLQRRDLGKARRDFEQALKLSPSHLGAMAGLAESTAERGVKGPAQALQAALAALPRREPGRVELLRRLARLADGPLKDVELARWAWAEVLGEAPQDAGAQRRLTTIARKTGDAGRLEQLLRAQLEREPRGDKAREAWRELVGLLDKAGRGDEALETLRQAVRYEPGHKEAWLLLAERLVAKGKNGEAAWAYEQAATATRDDAERQQAWVRLARFTREVLKDPQRAAVYATRAENLRQALEEAAVSAPPPPPTPPPSRPRGASSPTLAALPGPPPPPEELATMDVEVITDPGTRTGSDDDFDPERITQRRELPATRALGDGDAPTRKTEEIELPRPVDGSREPQPSRRGAEEAPSEAPPDARRTDPGQDGWARPDTRRTDPEREPVARPDTRRTDPEREPVARPDAQRTDPEREPVARLDAQRTDPEQEILEPEELEPEPTWGGAYPSKVQERLFAKVHAEPLEPSGYEALAEYFEDLGDADRSGLMAEIAAALEGDPAAAPRGPRLILSAADRGSLRHPLLRGEEGELLGEVGVALCQLFGDDEGEDGEEFAIDAGRGAPAAAEALQVSVRILGLRAPEVYLSPESGPPFSLAFKRTPRLLVGRAAVERQLPEAELRFFAGRALFAQNPDLLALRQLTLEQLEDGLELLELALLDGRSTRPGVRELRALLPKKRLDGLRELYERVRDALDLGLLAEGARHSANRAGLVVCGGVAPALAALRAKRAPEDELMELVRFAASERYLKLRQRRIG